MKYTKQELIDKILQHPDVLKALNDVASSEDWTDERENAKDELERLIKEVGSPIFKECTGLEVPEDIGFETRMGVKGWFELRDMEKGADFRKFLYEPEVIEFQIYRGDDMYIWILDYEINDDKMDIDMSISFTGDGERDRMLKRMLCEITKVYC